MQTPHPDFPVIDAHVHLYPDALAPNVGLPLTDNERRQICCETARQLLTAD